MNKTDKIAELKKLLLKIKNMKDDPSKGVIVRLPMSIELEIKKACKGNQF